jgi:hypothetical protein
MSVRFISSAEFGEVFANELNVSCSAPSERRDETPTTGRAGAG